MIMARGPVDFRLEKRIFRIFSYVPKSVLHSEQSLSRMKYFYSGGIHKDDIQSGDQLVSIDSDAFRIKNTKGVVKKLRNGTYGEENPRAYKLCGVVTPGGQLYVIMEAAKPHLADIGPYMPVRVSGIREIHKVFDTQLKLAI